MVNSTQRAIARRRELGPIPRRRPFKPKVPSGIEREYRRSLREYIALFMDTVKEVILPQLQMLTSEAQLLRPDSKNIKVNLDDWAQQIEELITATSIWFERRAPKPEDVVGGVAASVSAFNKSELNRAMRAAAGVDVFLAEPYLASTLASFRNQNVALIKNITANEITQIEGILQRGLQQGRSARAIGAEINARTGIANRRADLIARDQVASLNGELTTMRAQEIGATRARWVTAGDERVRPEHEARNGQVYDLATGIDGEWPGIPINCRCVAEIILDNLLDSV